MNKKNAKRLSLSEAKEVLPQWWNEMFETVLSIIKHSKYNSFKKAETFISTGLSYIPDKKTSEIKHIVVKCTNKGEYDGKIYITLVIYFHMKNKCFWELSKSIHVFVREKSMSYD